jgi:hypothetical protein
LESIVPGISLSVTWVPDAAATAGVSEALETLWGLAPDFPFKTKVDIAMSNAIATAKATTNEEVVID